MPNEELREELLITEAGDPQSEEHGGQSEVTGRWDKEISPNTNVIIDIHLLRIIIDILPMPFAIIGLEGDL